MHGPPRGPLGSGPEWPEDEDEWVERPARRPRRPAVAVAEPEPGTRSPRQKQPKRKKRPLSPAEKRLRRFRYAALLGVMAFASLGGAAFSFNLVALAVLSMVLCLPCAVLYLYF